MDLYFFVKTLHILSATVLFGTGLGIAFFFFRAHRQAGLAERHLAAKTTVLADFAFTLPAVILQPLTGAWLASRAGLDFSALWLKTTFLIYILAGCCWLPVVWIQMRLKTLLAEALASGAPLPAHYNRLFRWWFLLGWPAFLGLCVVFYLMVAKPT